MTVDDLMAVQPVIPVITIERVEDAIPLATALASNGLRVLEVTLRTAAGGEENIAAITRFFERG